MSERWPYDEITRNAVLAALDERIARLERHAMVLNIDEMLFVDTEDHQRDVVWTNDAILQAKRAREEIGEAEATPPEQADPLTAAKAESDREYHPWQSSAAAEAVR